MKRRQIIQKLQAANITFDPAASKDVLKALLATGPVTNRFDRTYNFASGRGKIKVAYNAADPLAPVDITITEQIGKDPWTGDGFTLADVQNACDGITPRTRTLNFFVDSPGGSYNVGTSIHNYLSQWPGPVNKTIIGVAASTASWMIPADKTFAYKNSHFFAHRAMCQPPVGNRDDMQEAVQQLDQTDRQIAEMYADQSGNTVNEMLDLMRGNNGQGTLLTGQMAKDRGFVDELLDGDATNQFSPEWLTAAQAKLTTLNQLRPKQGENNPTPNNTMTRAQKIALLNKRGITTINNLAITDQVTDAAIDSAVAESNIGRTINLGLLNAWGVTVDIDNSTDAALAALAKNGKPAAPPAPAPVPTTLNAADQQLFTDMRNQLAINRRRDIQAVVDKAASEGKIDALEIENWVNDAVEKTDHPTNGNPVLARLNKLRGSSPGIAAIAPERTNLDVVNADIKDIIRGFEAHNDVTKSWQRGNSVSHGNKTDADIIRNEAVKKAIFFKKMRNRLVEICNTNIIDAGLQRQVILQDVVIRDFARRIANLSMFSTVFRDIPLMGTSVVDVPYFDLDSSASQSFKDATGYNTLGNTASSVRPITVGQGSADDGAPGIGHNRAYIGLAFNSRTIAQQPYFKTAELAGLKAEKLAFDIFQDVLSVITAANFGAAVITKAAAQFDSDQLALLKLACKAWPIAGRGLMLDSAYDANLMQDPTFKSAYQAAFDSVKTEGRLNPRLYGFDYTENPNIPANGFNLVGFAFWKFAILVAFAPVPPVEEVRNAGTTYELIVDPSGGASLEYRAFGDNVLDTAKNLIESNYGFAPGLKTALKPIVSA